MKKDIKAQIKNMEIKELASGLVKARAEVLDLIMDKNMGKLKDLKSVFKKRKEIALMETVVRQKTVLGQLEMVSTETKKETKQRKEQTEVVVDDLAKEPKSKAKARTKSVQK